MPRFLPLRWLRFLTVLLFAELVFPLWARDNEAHWTRIDSDHFSVLTDAGEKKGKDVAVRFEQMRAAYAQLMMKTRVSIPQPVSIIALKDNEEYSKVAPVRPDEGIARGGFFIAGDDRDYFVVDASRDDSWRAISGDLGRVLLNFNYPPAEDWFDDGFVQYFSSLNLDNTQMQIGGDPQSSLAQAGARKSFVDLLNQSAWLSISDLFATRLQNSSSQEPARKAIFEAQSWIVMHYLINSDKLSSTGNYLGMVEGQKLPMDEAIQKAYGMTASQLDQAVKDYFHTLAPTLQAQSSSRSADNVPAGLKSAAAPVTADVVGASAHDVPESQGQALVAEMSLRLPEHREQALKELNSISETPKADNAVVHRALGWDQMQQKKFDDAADEFAQASSIDPRDPFTHYYLALWKYREAQSSGRETKGLANMQQDLHIVLDWDPEFAEAYYMLAMAQLEGGGLRAAADSMRAAMRLAPRKQNYSLGMAKIYLAGKNWDAATALLQRLTENPDAGIASAARQNLQDIPYLKKYGIPPVHSTSTQAGNSVSPSGIAAPNQTSSTSQSAIAAPKPSASAAKTEAEDDNPELPIPTPQIDKRPIQYAKGKLISVDCSQNPAAVLTVSVGTKNLQLRTADYKSLALVGADQFSCAWTNQPVSVNYKAGSGSQGDLVSLELR
jgi:tetratricopeptide (TPR) repeat protein